MSEGEKYKVVRGFNIVQASKVKPTDNAGEFEKIIKDKIIRFVDREMDKFIERSFRQFGTNISQEEADDIESIMMSYRNVVAGLDWDGIQREYEKYKVK